MTLLRCNKISFNFMSDFAKSISRFNEFGSLRLVVSHFRMGIMPVCVKYVLESIKQRKSFNSSYSEIISSVEKVLVDKYGNLLYNAFKNSPFDEDKGKRVP